MRIQFRVLQAALTLAAGLTAIGAAPALPGLQVVLPVRVSEGAILLHGDWKFKYLPSSNVGGDDSFFQPAFDVDSWKTIPVPSHWELHGFAEPKYKRVDEGTGLYRRTFRVSAHWRGQRVMGRFDGVLYGFTVWVNGKRIGEWASSYNPVTFDITDALLPGDADNAIAVRVTTRSKGWELDTNDCWALSGIYREVTLFAVPALHFNDYTARTVLKPDGAAELQLEIVASAAANVAGNILSPDDKVAKEFRLTLPADGRGATNFIINAPQLWTAETPSHPRLVELCDELGFYVMCEVPFGYGDKNLTDPSFEEVLFTRARATVLRDKNRPSVIIWSMGNENPLTDLGVKTAGYTKELDPTRPVCIPTVGSYFASNIEQFTALPESVEVFAPHYPGKDRVRDYSEKLRRPIIFTEYAHSLGLAFDTMQTLWEMFYDSPRVAGGAVWLFQDQGIRRDARVTGQPKDAAKYAWPNATHYFDTAGTDGCDGIVYSDRTPQVDYWQVRKAYAPVRIAERRVKIRPGAQAITLHVENRHDFRTLAGMTLNWSLRLNGAAVQSGLHPFTAQPRGNEAVTFTLNLPADCAENVCLLDVACVNESGRTIVERSLRLEVEGGSAMQTLLAGLPAAGDLKFEQQDKIARVVHGQFSVNLKRDTGAIEIRSTSGDVLASGFFPHVGRKFTLGEELRVAKIRKEATESDLRDGPSPIWPDAFLRASEVQLALLTTKAGAGVLLAGSNMDIAVENSTNSIIISHNAMVAGRGNKGSDPDVNLKAGSVKRIAGQFTLLPLTAPWPASLTTWFGPANKTCEVSKPFYRSYDQ